MRIKKVFTAVSTVWLVADIILLVSAVFQRAYPVFPLVAVAHLCVPNAFLVFSMNYKFNKSAINKFAVSALCLFLAVPLIWTVVDVFNSVGNDSFASTFYNFAYLSQTRSETQDPDNYMGKNDFSEAENEMIKKYFPEKIPANAKDVKYRYIYTADDNTGAIRAGWTLPEKDYLAEKRRVSAFGLKTEKASTCITYKTPNGLNGISIIFYDSDFSVEYLYYSMPKTDT